jgi:hypothetical protein
MKDLLWLWIILILVALIVIVFISLPKSKKRYLGYIVRQAPSLIARYFV